MAFAFKLVISSFLVPLVFVSVSAIPVAVCFLAGEFLGLEASAPPEGFYAALAGLGGTFLVAVAVSTATTVQSLAQRFEADPDDLLVSAAIFAGMVMALGLGMAFAMVGLLGFDAYGIATIPAALSLLLAVSWIAMAPLLADPRLGVVHRLTKYLAST